MIMTVIGLSLIALLVAVAVAAVNGDIHLSASDLSRNRPTRRPRPGIDDYAYHLHTDNGYWAKCTDVSGTNAVNQQGSTANRRPVPGQRRANTRSN